MELLTPQLRNKVVVYGASNRNLVQFADSVPALMNLTPSLQTHLPSLPPQKNESQKSP